MAGSQSRGNSPLNPDLREVVDQLARIKEDAQTLCAGLSDRQFNWRPAAGVWSISECLEHLNLADADDISTLGTATSDARARNLLSAGPFRYGAISNWFVKSVEPPPKHKAKAAQKVTPRPELSLQDVLSRFVDIHDRLARTIEQANGVDLVRLKVPSPVGPFKLPLGQKLRLIAGHDRRHLYQAWQVRKNPGFPSS
jgi:DinB family protein